MENLNERAANYAAEKTKELLAKAIAQAYADGYQDGVKDRDERIASPNIEFVDLGLPSGTKWSTKLMGEDDFADYLAYADAASYGKNGKEIYIRSWGYKEGDNLRCYGYGADKIFFWIHNEEENAEMKAIMLYNVKDEKPELEIVKLFSGYKVPVMLVRNQ